MTSSQWLDIAIIGVALIAAISGWRSGALGSAMSFVGVVLGAIAGVMLAPHIVSHVHSPRAKLFAALFLILALVVIGEVAGVVLGRAVRGCHPQPPGTHCRLVHRRRAATGGRAVRGVAAGHPADLVRSAEPRRGRPRLEGARRGRQVRTGVAASGAQANVRAVEHIRAARRAAAVRPHPDPGGRRPGRRRWPTVWSWPTRGPAWSRSAVWPRAAKRCSRAPVSSSLRTG